jgi:hypothetical protein
MEEIFGTEYRLILAASAGALAVLLIVSLAWRRWRVVNSAEGKLRRAANDVMSNLVIPDVDDSEIILEYVLLTARGVIILDVRDVSGHVFGSDAMEEWTVLSEQERFTFSNPQHGLYDRIAAVRRLLPDIPVDGYVAFTSRGEFSKGQPSQVVMLESLVDELVKEKTTLPPDSIEPYLEQWNRLRDEAAGPQSVHTV